MAKLIKGSAAAKKHMAAIRSKKKVSTHQTGVSNKTIDKRIEAKKPGKRVSKSSKKIYYERRRNRSDKGVLLGIGAIKKKTSDLYKVINNAILEEVAKIARLKEMIKGEKRGSLVKKKYQTELKNCQKNLTHYRSQKRKFVSK